MKALNSMTLRLALPLAAAFAASLTPVASFADTGTSAASSSSVAPKDYFHSGAGARYLARAKTDLEVRPQRGNITVILGSGGNITVLSGPNGKFLVDAGISPSKEKLQAAFATLGPEPVKYVVNTHWHWDHTDGNEWLHAAGATIVAHPNTLKHLSESTYVVD